MGVIRLGPIGMISPRAKRTVPNATLRKVLMIGRTSTNRVALISSSMALAISGAKRIVHRRSQIKVPAREAPTRPTSCQRKASSGKGARCMASLSSGT